jgi:hypothetical protein
VPEIAASIDLVVVTIAREKVPAPAISLREVLAIAREAPANHHLIVKEYCRGSAERSFPLMTLLKKD